MCTLPKTLAPRFATVILWCTTLVALHGCDDLEDRRGGGTDLFQLALDEAPGGALLSAWVDPDAAIEPIAYVAGGYVGVARADVADGNLGRLLRYEAGAFVTVCRTPQVLWWVQGGLDGTVVAAGQDGIVLRYREDDRSCDVSYVDGDWPTGLPTLWGLYGTSADDIRFVGGSIAPDGPKGVILHWDGATYTREPVPESAELNLFKIARAGDRLYVVGDGGTVLHRYDAGAGDWRAEPPLPLGVDSTLFTISCASSGVFCVAVGGRSSGSVVISDGLGGWLRSSELGAPPGLNGVAVENSASVYIVGERGQTLHFNGVGFYRPPRALTTNPLHGVASNFYLSIAVGGEIGNATADQRGTILVRGYSPREQYTLDGQVFEASGAPRSTLGDSDGQ